MDKVTSIKLKYDLLEYVRLTTNSQGKGRKFLCPFHQERTPSFVVFRDGHYKCFGCGKTGDIINFVADTRGISVQDAIHQLESEIEPQTIIRETPQAVMPRETEISYNYIRENHDNLGAHINYFKARAIAEHIIHRKLLGFDEKYPHFYRFGDGQVMQMQTPRYTIPYLCGDKVRGLNARLDDKAARELFSKMPEALRGRIITDLRTKLKLKEDSIDIELILSSIFGGKYLRKNPFMIYNSERIMLESGMETTFPKRSYVFITEGEFDCLSIESAGFAAIAAKPSHMVDFPKMFQNVLLPVIIADNDKPKEDHIGKLHQVGLENAQAIQRMIGRGRVIMVPNGFKDINEMMIAGEGTKFLSRYADPERELVC